MNTMVVKYEYELKNNTHIVHVQSGAEVRHVYFPSNSTAIDFMRRIDEYSRLKSLEQIREENGVA